MRNRAGWMWVGLWALVQVQPGVFATESENPASTEAVAGNADCSAADSRPKQTLTGIVLDAAGAPVQGATITVACGSVEVAVSSDAAGAYSVSLAPGRYVVRVEKGVTKMPGEELVVPEGQGTKLDLTLPVGSVVESVTVGARVDAEVTRRPSTTATKTSTSLLETPQAVTVVTSERIQDMGAEGLQDALNYSAGVRSDAFGLDSRTDSVLVRGGYPDEYLDGMRQLFNYYTSTTRTDPYLLERIEVLRGPSGMLYGQGTTAGVVNLVSKMPKAERFTEVGLEFGSFSRKQAQADITGPIDSEGKWLYRLIALGRLSDTQVDYVPDDRALVAPSLSWVPNDSTTWTFQFRWQQDKSGSTLQFLPWSGNVVDNPNGTFDPSVFIGDPDDHYDSERLSAGWLFQHRFNDRWTVRQNLRVVRNKVDYVSLYADSFSSPGDSFVDENQRMIGRYAWSNETEVDLLTADQHAEGQVFTGPVEHRVLAGIDTVFFRENASDSYDYPDYLGGTVPSIDAFNPVYPEYTPLEREAYPESNQSQVGFYLQDQMKFGKSWIALLGLRHDRARNGIDGSETDKHEATTGRVGLMYAAEAGFSPYLSYSQSFTPVAGTDFYGERYEPMRGSQIEAGIKVQPRGKPFSVTAAIFELKEENRLINDPENPLNSIQAGETETRGLELEFFGKIGSSFDLTAHYNYLENDEQLDGVPKHQTAAWGTQRFTLGLKNEISAGLGFRYFSAFTDATAPQTPAIGLFDAMISLERSGWRYALNVSNLADETYVSTCLPRGDCFVGARRTANLSASYRF